jgi:hypothetical protein
MITIESEIPQEKVQMQDRSAEGWPEQRNQ